MDAANEVRSGRTGTNEPDLVGSPKDLDVSILGITEPARSSFNLENRQSLQSADPGVAGTTHPPPSLKPDASQGNPAVSGLTDQTNYLPVRKIVLVFLGLSVGALVSSLDMTLAATALTTITADFHSGSVSSFIPSVNLLTSTAFQPLYGRFSDIFGRKAAISLAISVFMIGNLAAGFSRNVTELIIFRGISGAGGGGITSMLQVIISDIVSLRDRGKYIGIAGVVIAAGTGVGPLIGGAFSENASWRWCFWVTVPISVFSIALVNFVLPLKSVEGDMKKKLLAVDYVGTMLTLGGCTLLMLPLIWGGTTFPWSSAIVLVTLFCGCFVLALFCLWEWKGARIPIIPMYIFKHQTVTGVFITSFVNGFVSNASLYYLPQFFEIVLGSSPIRAGILLLPVLVSQVFGTIVAGNIVSRTGRYRAIVYSGFGVWAIGCGLLSTLRPGTKTAVIVVYMLIAGLSSGQSLQTTTVAAQASVPRRDMSVVTVIRNFMRSLGGALSLAIGSTIINNSLRDRMTSLGLPAATITSIVDTPTVLHSYLSGPSTANATTNMGISSGTAHEILDGYISGFRILFQVNAALTAACAIISYVMIKHKELLRGDEAKLRQDALDAEKKPGKVAPGVPGEKASDGDLETGIEMVDVKSSSTPDGVRA
ncbi:hypothetical protein M0805_002867 [Coniferiporia weirii]|nr:hypothetical protein M0805_002867 [Coniferiporia weirii]